MVNYVVILLDPVSAICKQVLKRERKNKTKQNESSYLFSKKTNLPNMSFEAFATEMPSKAKENGLGYTNPLSCSFERGILPLVLSLFYNLSKIKET